MYSMCIEFCILSYGGVDVDTPTPRPVAAAAALLLWVCGCFSNPEESICLLFCRDGCRFQRHAPRFDCSLLPAFVHSAIGSKEWWRKIIMPHRVFRAESSLLALARQLCRMTPHERSQPRWAVSYLPLCSCIARQPKSIRLQDLREQLHYV